MTVLDQTWSPSLATDDPVEVDEKQVGDLGAMIIAATGLSTFVTFDPTGFENGESFLEFYFCAGRARTAYGVQTPVIVLQIADAQPVEDLLNIALVTPYVAVPRPEEPELTDNLVDEACVLSGLTKREVADLLDVSERYLMRLRRYPEAMGREREDRLRALRTIGGALIGGLGKRRTAEWLRHGDPSPLDLIRSGHTDEVLEIARRVKA